MGFTLGKFCVSGENKVSLGQREAAKAPEFKGNVLAVESYKEARMQDPEEARYEEMSRKMDIKRKAAAKMHCTK